MHRAWTYHASSPIVDPAKKFQHSISEHVQVVQLAVSGSAIGLSRARTSRFRLDYYPNGAGH
jgi:hypothetical protein